MRKIADWEVRQICEQRGETLALAEAIRHVKNSEGLLWVIRALGYWNEKFKYFVTGLNYSIGMHSEFSKIVTANAAAKVLEATKEEFFGDSGDNANHTVKAEYTISSVAKYFGITHTPDLLIHEVESSLAVISGQFSPNNHNLIDSGLGGLLGSEQQAAAEFQTIKEVLKARDPDLWNHLQSVGATAWIELHAGEEGVEILHAKAALEAANIWIEHGGDREKILRGMHIFLARQKEFAESLYAHVLKY